MCNTENSWAPKVNTSAVTLGEKARHLAPLSRATMELWRGIHQRPPPRSLKGAPHTGQPSPLRLPPCPQHPHTARLPPPPLEAKTWAARPQRGACANPRRLHRRRLGSRQSTWPSTARWWGRDPREASASWDAAVWCPMKETWFMTNSSRPQCR